jgi:hypothetical protein
MKSLFALAFFASLINISSAQSMSIPDYNWTMNDIAAQGITKEKLFTSMDRDLIKVGQSICSNRALMWVYDFKRKQNIDASKIFLFFTNKTGSQGRITWWYHVSPIVNENGNMWVMDAGFPGAINTPLTVSSWLTHFTKTDQCKQIKASETELVEHIFKAAVYPEETSYGKYDCYYKIVPAGYWTPNAVAMNLLGRNSAGTPVSYNREEIDSDEVYAACVEATTNSFGRIFGGGKKKCKKYLNQ